MQDVFVYRSTSLDASWWPPSKSWDCFPWVPSAVLAAQCHRCASAYIPSMCHPAVGRFCPPPHPHLTSVSVSWSARQAFALRHDPTLRHRNAEFHAAIWIWHRCFSGCCDRCGKAWCLPPSGSGALPWLMPVAGVQEPAGSTPLPAKSRLNVPLLYQAPCATANILLINGRCGWKKWPWARHSCSNPSLALDSQAKNRAMRGAVSNRC